MERRTIIRLLIVVGIGIPLIIEGATFFGLVSNQLFGGEQPGDHREPVGIGDEVVPATEQTERLTDAHFETVDGERRLVVEVTVRNTGNDAYEFRLDAVTLADGTRLTTNATSGELARGETTTVSASWTVAGDAQVDSVNATTVVSSGSATITNHHSAPLAPVSER
ncbi:CARDB domain-containing protein [Haloarchaeobius sp. DT45]|uniref:CARDB domain-containing protein n=1 Tax=Haloarchaeobius sp. DT45 TaxID=3446116 RepID=UPI003F6D5062